MKHSGKIINVDTNKIERHLLKPYDRTDRILVIVCLIGLILGLVLGALGLRF